MWPSWRISSFEHLSYFVPTVLLPNRKNVLFSLVCHGNRNDYLHQENALFRGTKMGRQSKGVESWGLVDSVWAWASVQQPWMGENVFTSREDHFSWLVWFIWIIFTWFFFFKKKLLELWCQAFNLRTEDKQVMASISDPHCPSLFSAPPWRVPSPWTHGENKVFFNTNRMALYLVAKNKSSFILWYFQWTYKLLWLMIWAVNYIEVIYYTVTYDEIYSYH